MARNPMARMFTAPYFRVLLFSTAERLKRIAKELGASDKAKIEGWWGRQREKFFLFFFLRNPPLVPRTSRLTPRTVSRCEFNKSSCVLRPAVNWLHNGYLVKIERINRALTVILLLMSLISSVVSPLLEQETLQVV